MRKVLRLQHFAFWLAAAVLIGGCADEVASVKAQEGVQEPRNVPGIGIAGTRAKAGGPLKLLKRVWLEQELRGPNNFGITYPYDTALIGPVLALRSKLLDDSLDSLRNASTGSPVLVRFEIYDAWSDASVPEYMGPPRNSTDDSPFRLRALLYWTSTRQGSDTPIGSVRLRYLSKEKSAVIHGAQLGKVVVEKREYVVKPGKSYKLGTSIIQEDWKVQGEGVVLETETRAVGDSNDAVAFFDISQRSFEPDRARTMVSAKPTSRPAGR
jgi:hypothetical protein